MYNKKRERKGKELDIMWWMKEIEGSQKRIRKKNIEWVILARRDEINDS